MREATALEVALSLFHLPSRVRTLRASELPSDLEIVLRIVAGDDRTLAESLRLVDETEQDVMAAARFYIEQVLLHPDADSYRVLGVNPDATTDLLRRHMALLLRWLHPDRDKDGVRSAFVGRITEAWNNLKTSERRAAYDAARGAVSGGSRGPPARAKMMAPVRSATPVMNGREKHFGDRNVRRHSTPRGVWHFLRHLIGQYR
jgi:hypothetical protein